MLFAVTPQVLYLKEVSIPHTVYDGMIFQAKYSLLVLEDRFDNIETDFKSSGIAVINPSNKWTKTEGNNYENTFLYKVQQKDAKLPEITAKLLRNGRVIGTDSIGQKEIEIIDINIENFSGIFAGSLKLEESKVAPFDDESNIIIFELSAIDSNLEDFNLKAYEKQGTESFKGNYSNSDLIYYLIIKKNKSTLDFKYFDTTDQKLKELHIKNVPTDERVSTQSDLKPKNTFLMTKLLVLGAVIFIFLTLYVLKRKRIFLLITLIFAAVLFFYIFQKGTVSLKSGTPIYILPTKNSTVVFQTSGKQEAKILSTKNGYIKIEIDDKIGWIKRADAKD